MNKTKIYPNEWIQIHPYKSQQPSDSYFVALANRLYSTDKLTGMPEHFRKKLCLYLAAYLEDVISGLGLWQSFIGEHKHLYGRPLPFYPLSSDYMEDEINLEDVRFLIWNTWQKAHYEHPYINPMNEQIMKQAEDFYQILEEAYEEAPENEMLNRYFDSFKDITDAEHKLTWLFGHTYLTEPAMQPYIEQVKPTDRYIIPTGPLALFLHEWIGLLTDNKDWKKVPHLYTPDPVLPENIRNNHKQLYQNFTEGTDGKHIVYLNGYESLHRFLVDVLKWPDDEGHTLPQMKAHRNFVLMTEPEKGILLAKDICEYIADPENPMYDRDVAGKNAFRLLTEEMLCPPDLLTYCIRNRFLPDATIPGYGENELVEQNADFIARHSLLYYYRGD
ncbi:DUF3843 family protein [uncultured Bacteroides sp.]|uniref:DUF3843 family protein n=1 Tax=uncultured Bacteroides sp. TaxID=162156 RepID=UPI00263176F6|nr:DUF3843 family protein [uncultured Bacteroides sp.]